jgi:hypothetical protein
LAVVTAFALAGCGEVSSKKPDGGDGDTAPAGDFTLTIDQSALTIPIAGQATVTVTVAPNGSVGDITLTADGLGSNLEVTFSPNPITTGTSTATIRVKGGTAPGTSTVTLTGTAGDKTHSATVSVTTTTITVSGTVRGGRSGITVGLVGKTSVTSGAGGVFTFTDVTPPYDLYTVIDTGCSSSNTPTKGVYYFDDLTRPDPVVTAATAFVQSNFCLLGFVFCSSCNAAVTASRTGSGNGTDRVVADWSGGSFSISSSNASTITGTAYWRSGTTNTGNLYALQFTRKATDAPDTYLGFAKSGNKTLTGGQADTIALTFGPVSSTATLTGTLTQPAGYPAATISLRQEFGPESEDLWTTTTTNTVDATIPLISAAGGTNLNATSTLNGGVSEYVYPLTTNTVVNFTMPAAAVLTNPAANATGVTTATPFMWTPGTNTVSELNISGGLRNYHIYTTASQLTIPVLTEAPLPSGQTLTWRVYGYGPHSSVNDAAAGNELEQVSATDFQGPEHAFTTSPARSFSTP